MHPFFTTVKNYPELNVHCRSDLTKLPKPFYGQSELKAILLGADPTNNGVRNNAGLKELDNVFGINSEYERDFWDLQSRNLSAIGLNKENLYIQNVCRNYFTDQTSKNKYWNKIATIWLPYMNEELEQLNHKIPILVTAEKIMKLLIPETPPAEEIYSMAVKADFYSDYFKRKVYPLYRNLKYNLTADWPDYKEFLIRSINE